MKGLRQLSGEEVLFDKREGQFIKVDGLDRIEIPENGIPEGKVVLQPLGENSDPFVEYSEDLDFAIHEEEVIKVKERVLNQPIEVLIEFAEKELKEYHQRIGDHHPYNGIEGIDQIFDLRTALLASNTVEIRESKTQ